MFINTVPMSGSAIAHMIGGLAFERSLAEVYSTLEEQGPSGTAEAYHAFVEDMTSPGSPCYEVARTYIVQVFGGRCDIQQMDAALKGYIAEAGERFVTRVNEIRLDRIQTRIESMSQIAGADWAVDAADTVAELASSFKR